MKKIFIISVILCGILFAVPEFVILGVASRIIATAAGLIASVILLYKFQVSCSAEVHKMREEQEKRLREEENTVIVGITPRQLWELAKNTLPKVFKAIALGLAVYLAISFSWSFIAPVLKYVGYGIGVLVAILLVVCVFTPSREKVEEMEKTGDFC